MSQTFLNASLGASLVMPAALLAQPAASKLRSVEIAGARLLQSHGRVVRRLARPGRTTRARPYGGVSRAACHGDLPRGGGWKPNLSGLTQVCADGEALIGFTRWSESLYVSKRLAAPDLQIARAPMTQKER